MQRPLAEQVTIASILKVQLIDIALVLGFAVPLILPLFCIACMNHLAVFRLAVERLGAAVQYEAKPACLYLLATMAHTA